MAAFETADAAVCNTFISAPAYANMNTSQTSFLSQYHILMIASLSLSVPSLLSRPALRLHSPQSQSTQAALVNPPLMSFLPRQRPAPLVEDDEDGGSANGDGSVQLDSLALLLATAYLLAYLTLHTLTGWASVATAVPLTAALLWHWYRDSIPHSTAASIERQQSELSAMVRAAVVFCSDRKKRGLRSNQSFTLSTVEAVNEEADEQTERAEDDGSSSLRPAPLSTLHSPPMYLRLTSPNAHSHPIELSEESAAARQERRTAAEAEAEEQDGKHASGSSGVAVERHSSQSQQRRPPANTAPTRSTTATGAAAALLSPKTLDATADP